MTPKISDHALVRWLERCHGLDVEGFRAQLAALAEPFVAARVKHAPVGGLWLVFDGAVLVTVLPSKPMSGSLLRNDREVRNGTDVREEVHWKHRARRRRRP